MEEGQPKDLDSSLDASFKQKYEAYDSKSRRSVFNITLGDTLKSESAQFKASENKLIEEINEWARFWKENRKAVKAADRGKYSVDVSSLPEHKRKYLEDAPNIQMFIRDSIAFRNEANVYMNFHQAEYLEWQYIFNEMYEHRLNVRKENTVKELLANQTPAILKATKP